MRSILTDELRHQVEAKIRDIYGARLREIRFTVEAWREPTRVIAQFTLTRHDKTLHYPMEAGVPLTEDKPSDIEDAMWLGFDFLSYYLGQYLDSGGETLLSLDWMPVAFGDSELFARGWERNLALEEAADRWLAGESVDVRESIEDRIRRKNRH